MRLFTILGVIFLVIGIGLAVLAILPGEAGIWGDIKTQAAGWMAVTFVPMGLIFTAIGVAFGRMTAKRKRLLREGIPGTARVLSLSGGNMVINNIHYMITFELLVTIPGRPPYQVEHKQLVPIYGLASVPVGSTVPVMVDRDDPRKLTLDLSGEAAALRQAAALMGTQAQSAQVVPNQLSTMQGASPNTFTSDLEPAAPTSWPSAPVGAVGSLPGASVGVPGAPAGMPAGMPGAPMVTGAAGALAGAALGAVQQQLAQLGITIDPEALAQGAVVVNQGTTTLDASPGGQAAAAALLANGNPGVAFVREARDTGIDVHGDSVVELTLDVTPQGGTAYEVRTAALVPASARARALPGASVPVRIDPAQATNVVIDWG